MKNLILFLFMAVGLFAQTHPHIKSLKYTPDSSLFEWTSVEHYDADEEPATEVVETWRVSFSQITMEHRNERRKFDVDEAQIVGAGFHRFSKFLEYLSRQQVEVFSMDPAVGTVTVNNIQVFWSDCKPNLTNEDCYTLNDIARRIVRYAAESIYWWRDGQGEPTKDIRI